MQISRPWALRLTAAIGCLLLLAGTIASAVLLIPHSWHDLDDATVRMHILRIHGIDGDYIWSVVAFGSVVLTVVAMFICCLWLFWMLPGYWNRPLGKDEGQR
jgi:hypothetical protein